MNVDEIASLDRRGGDPDRNTKTNDRIALGDMAQRDLVALGDSLDRRQLRTRGASRPLIGGDVAQSDTDIVALIEDDHVYETGHALSRDQSWHLLLLHHPVSVL